MKRLGPKHQKGDRYFPKHPIPLDGKPGFIYPTDGSVVVEENLGKEHHKTIVVVVDEKTGRRSQKIKAQLYLAKHSRA